MSSIFSSIITISDEEESVDSEFFTISAEEEPTNTELIIISDEEEPADTELITISDEEESLDTEVCNLLKQSEELSLLIISAKDQATKRELEQARLETQRKIDDIMTQREDKATIQKEELTNVLGEEVTDQDTPSDQDRDSSDGYLYEGPEQECYICKDKISKGCLAITLPCGHIYDEECIKKWANVNPVCPVDREPFFMAL